MVPPTPDTVACTGGINGHNRALNRENS
jgi:hypothetical protein